MANDKNFKIKNGLKAGRYLQNAGVETAGTNGPFGVFDTTLYTGNGSTQTITNNIDLAGDGGLIWIKQREASWVHLLQDTTMSRGHRLDTATNAAIQNNSGYNITSISSTGFGLTDNSDGLYGVNGSAGGTYAGTNAKYVAWTFKKQAKFFDIVTYTGDGTTARQIAHSLGVSPGVIIVKTTNVTDNWHVYHRDLTQQSFGGNVYTHSLALNSTAAEAQTISFRGNAQQTNSVFTLGLTGSNTNETGKEYVAYLFAHDTASDSNIKCGSYTGNGSATGVLQDLGWEPSWVMIKNSNLATENWHIVDSKRGVVTGGNDPHLSANTSGAEVSHEIVEFSSTGFTPMSTDSKTNGSGKSYIYMAIRGIVPTKTLDLSTGHTFSFTPSAATDILFSNPPASGSATGFSVEVNNSGGYALTWPSSIKWHLGTAPTATASKELYTFVTTDGGTTYYGKLAAGDIA